VLLEALDTELVGDDTASLRVRAAAGTPSAAAPEAPAKLSERERIEALLGAIASSGIVFIRNRSDHSASDAVDHLRSKWSRGCSHHDRGVHVYVDGSHEAQRQIYAVDVTLVVSR